MPLGRPFGERHHVERLVLGLDRLDGRPRARNRREVGDGLLDGDLEEVAVPREDEVAVEETITYFSTVPSARAAIEAIETKDEPLDVMALSERPTERHDWGE